MTNRTDEFGRAFAGSQLQIQTYVNRRQRELNAALLAEFSDLQSMGLTFEWVSPLEEDRFTEYHDGGFLNRLGLTELAGELADFWPQGGPRWDALARIHFESASNIGVLLVEAKSHPGEMNGTGCLATEPAMSRIRASLAKTTSWTGAVLGDWTGAYYQFANRLAHLYFLREVCGVPAWLVNICFFDDPYKPTGKEVLREALDYPRQALGLKRGTIPFCQDVFLPGVGRELLDETLRPNNRTGGTASRGTGKEWRFLRNDHTGRHRFLGFANARGSCSLRYFDAKSGASLGDPRYGRGRDYQDVFAVELAASTSVAGPPGVLVSSIPPDTLKKMRLQAGLDEGIETPPPEQGSLLSGVDALIDEALGVSLIGATSPHYRHRSSYRHVAESRNVDGAAFVSGMYRRIRSNWPGTTCRGDQNWRMAPAPYIDPENKSLEKRLEKAIVEHCPGWVNMVPVCSGVMPVLNEGGRRIDLVRPRGDVEFEFLELKVGDSCDTPLYAAMEILGYGLIYLFSRRNVAALGYSNRNRLLTARAVSLIVLAPAEAYAHGSLRRLEAEINRGLGDLLSSADQVRIDFRFESFPPGASWDPEESPQKYLDSRGRTYAD